MPPKKLQGQLTLEIYDDRDSDKLFQLPKVVVKRYKIILNLQEGVKLAKDVCHGMRHIHSIEAIVNRFDLNPHSIVVRLYCIIRPFIH